ncbi:sulfotransferase family protein [Novosphingobium sp. ZW T3_23]|uniref:sulfotransferase family protein n=1 Tax=Novosphingobium sp. ZW T3_23 TaxID=3378084 RepID=UPI00385242EA
MVLEAITDYKNYCFLLLLGTFCALRTCAAMDLSIPHVEASVPARVDPGETWVDRLNSWLETCWRRGWLSRPQLYPDALLSASRRITGLDEFGADNGWAGRLDLLCRALHDEASLSPLGTTIAYGQLVAALSNRLRAVELWRRHPEIADVPISRPILIIGQMRSGSTRTQRMLGCDPQLTCTRFFESWNPLPRWSLGGLDDRVLRAWLALRIARWLNPRFDVVHPTGPREIDEEIGIHNIALFGAAFEAQWRIPSFARAIENSDNRLVYAEFRRFLQTIRWLRRDTKDKPWVLKLPQFGQDLRAVSEAFPDARVIVLDRDPVSVVSSSASLVFNQMGVQSREVDPAWIGREWLWKTHLRRRRISEGLDRHGGPVIRVNYDDMQADWHSQIKRIYTGFGLDLTPGSERKMTRFAGRSQHERLRAHEYRPEQYGLSASKIARALDCANWPQDLFGSAVLSASAA